MKNFRRNFKYLIGIGVFSFSFATYSQTYIIRSPQTSIAEFRAFMETENAQTYAQEQLQLLRKEMRFKKQELLSLLERAQESFLKEHLKDSSDYFRSITNMAYSYDWDDESKEVIFYAFLRLSQIESKNINADSFLHSAAVLAPHLDPDDKIFPPPFIKIFNEMKKSLPRLSIRPNLIFPYHEIVLINGQEVPVNESLSLPYGDYRITALSSSHRKWSRIVSVSELARKRVVTSSWVQGSCKHAVVPQSLQGYFILFPNFCLWKKSLNKTSQTKAFSQQVLHDQKNSYTKPQTISPWIWVGGGIGLGVVAFIMFYRGDNEKPATKEVEKPITHRPTVKIGF